ncbi:MAG: right-handed parallel beta-helix repeat-containing protein [Planctomycetes bacterium]|nr:right-handed parallel beta-helix repeat-containing protein [Planctomycetota bacterium]
MFSKFRQGTFFIVTLAASSLAAADVRDDDSLRRALSDARPGTQIRIAPGEYRPGVYASGLQGTADQPIVIQGADPQNPPVFEGGSTGWHLIDCAHLVVRHIAVRGQTGNGINIDDGGSYDTPSHHIVLESLHVSCVGPTGNRDGIKLSGVDDFVVRDCTVDGWAGQAIDMVGCHRGLIEGCRFVGREGYSQTTGPQTKGGSSDVLIRRCVFRDAGQRAVNLGGSTGMDFFRPPGARYEARNITVEGCVFVGSMAPIAFVGVDGATVRYNTIYRPEKWVLRILQETTAPGFPPCRNGRFERNLVVFRAADVSVAVNIGPNTDPASFQFADNLWYCEDRPQASRPDLPSRETGGVYGVDPKLKGPAENLFRPGNAEAADFGAYARSDAGP